MEKLFSAKGRINRKTYLISCGMYVVLGIIAGFLSQSYFPTMGTTFKGFALFLLCSSPFIYIGYCLTIKRLHDLDRPASDIWRLNLSWTLQYRLLLEEGTHGKNQYGYPQS